MAKYIIDIASPNVRNEYIVYWTYGGLEVKRVSDLTPYTAPDLEQVRKEAYQKGLSDAWEAAKKIQDTGGNLNWWIHNVSASEAIEKIWQYEQEKEEFHVGDEFENGSGKKFVILKMDGAEIDRYIDEEGKTYCMSQKYKVMRKTGRHFPEIAAVLEKMKERFK